MAEITVTSETSSTKTNAAKSTKCVICGQNSSPKIVKDKNFLNMMGLYWDGIKVDVKPSHNKDYDLCAACFFNLKGLYETNDICIYFEANLNTLRDKILSQHLKSILKMQAENTPLLDVHRQIQQRWGTKLEPGEGKGGLLRGYKVTTSIEADKPGEASDNHELQKSPSAVVIPSESISGSDRATQPLKRAQSGSKTPKSKRKKRKKSVWSSSSDESTEELTDDSDF